MDSGNGRAITREEMLDLLDQADREGLVLQPENTKAPMFICCCCGCCCGVLTSVKRLPTPAAYFSSNFYATADAQLCQSCGSCEMRCQMNAITSPEDTAVIDRTRCVATLFLSYLPLRRAATGRRRPPEVAARRHQGALPTTLSGPLRPLGPGRNRCPRQTRPKGLSDAREGCGLETDNGATDRGQRYSGSLQLFVKPLALIGSGRAETAEGL